MTHPPDPVAAPPLDLKQLGALQRLLALSGEEGALAEMVEHLLANVEQSIALASEALGQGDVDTIEHIAHKLKGSCGNLGARRLMDAWAAIEAHTLARGDAGLYAGMIASVADEAVQTRAAFLSLTL